MSASTSQHVLRQVFSAFDQGDWTIFDSHPGLHETRQQVPHLRETESVESALSSYESRRRPRNDWVQQQIWTGHGSVRDV